MYVYRCIRGKWDIFLPSFIFCYWLIMLYDEAMSLWTHENYDDDELDIETSKYILDIIGDKFCQLVTSEKTALSWVKKDGKKVKYLEHATMHISF